MLYQNRYRDHVDAVETLADAGISAPAEWTKLHQRHQDFLQNDHGNARAALVNAIVNGTKADTGTLYSLALAEAASLPPAEATVRGQVEAAVLTRLYELYRPVARVNFATAADRFDAAAKKLVDAAAMVDIEADPESMVTAADPERTAWAHAAIASKEIDAATLVLAAAAHLAGLNIKGAEAMMALTVNPGDLKRRAVWEAHDSQPGRCGRWARLLAAGCTIEANRDLDGFTPYRRALPMQEKVVSTGRGSYRRVLVDPEQPAEPEAAPKKKIPGLLLPR